jgi:hypothetical protein
MNTALLEVIPVGHFRIMKVLAVDEVLGVAAWRRDLIR